MTEKRILPFQPAGIRCWIIFTDSVAAVTWRRWFSREGFRHCLVIVETGPGVCTWIEPQPPGLAIVHTTGKPTDFLRAYLAKGASVLFLHRQPLADPPHRRIPLASCADVVAYSIGIPNLIVTPWRLFKILTQRYGAVQLKESRDGQLVLVPTETRQTRYRAATRTAA